MSMIKDCQGPWDIQRTQGEPETLAGGHGACCLAMRTWQSVCLDIQRCGVLFDDLILAVIYAGVEWQD